MMIAKKTYPWGSLEVRFEVTNPGDDETMIRVMQAHGLILRALRDLEQPGSAGKLEHQAGFCLCDECLPPGRSV